MGLLSVLQLEKDKNMCAYVVPSYGETLRFGSRLHVYSASFTLTPQCTHTCVAEGLSLLVSHPADYPQKSFCPLLRFCLIKISMVNKSMRARRIFA
jgi:hypothetical protein